MGQGTQPLGTSVSLFINWGEIYLPCRDGMRLKQIAHGKDHARWLFGAPAQNDGFVSSQCWMSALGLGWGQRDSEDLHPWPQEQPLQPRWHCIHGGWLPQAPRTARRTRGSQPGHRLPLPFPSPFSFLLHCSLALFC